MTHEVNEPSAKYLARASHKRTAIGLIPQDWAVLALADIAAIERGKFSARPRNDPRYYGGEFPFIQTGDVTRSSGSITTFTQTLNREGLRVSRLFPEGTLFFTIAANIGDVGIAKFEAACPDSLVAIVPHAGIQKVWLLYELARRKSDFESLASPGAQLNINLEKLRPYLLPVPTEAEQRAIAAALSDVDALISGLEKLIAEKRDLKQAAMQQLLTGQTRLPGFSGEWAIKPLGDVAQIQKGQLITTETIVSGDVPVIAGGKKPAYFHNKPNRLGKTITVSASGASAGYVAFHRSPIFASDCSTISEAKTYCIEFVLFEMQLKQEEIYNAQTGGAQPHIQPKDLAPLMASFPTDLREQEAIASVLCDMDDELISLASRLAKTRELKQGMMQELLTGKTRLI